MSVKEHVARLSDREVRALACELLVSFAAEGKDIQGMAKRLMKLWKKDMQEFREYATSIVAAAVR